jgi:uncharacterized protein (DUF4415 family)
MNGNKPDTQRSWLLAIDEQLMASKPSLDALNVLVLGTAASLPFAHNPNHFVLDGFFGQEKRVWRRATCMVDEGTPGMSYASGGDPEPRILVMAGGESAQAPPETKSPIEEILTKIWQRVDAFSDVAEVVKILAERLTALEASAPAPLTFKGRGNSVGRAPAPASHPRTDFAKVDAHVVQPEEYDEVPELTDDAAAEAEVYHANRPARRGRPRTGNAKEAINIRLSQDVLTAFRETGPGWQTRIDEALRQMLGLERR